MTEVDSPRSAWDLAAASRVVIYIPAIFLLPPPVHPSSGIPRDVCGYLTRENNLRKYIALTCPPMQDTFPLINEYHPSDPRNSSYPPSIILPSFWSPRNIPCIFRLEIVLLKTFDRKKKKKNTRERINWKILFVAKERLISSKGNRRRVTLFVFPLSVFGGKRVRFSQFAPWPRKIAIGLGNTFTTGPGPVILLPKDFFFFFRFILYRNRCFFFFSSPSFRILVSGPFVPLMRFKRLSGAIDIYIPSEFQPIQFFLPIFRNSNDYRCSPRLFRKSPITRPNNRITYEIYIIWE